jgi:hypothetical protein
MMIDMLSPFSSFSAGQLHDSGSFAGSLSSQNMVLGQPAMAPPRQPGYFDVMERPDATSGNVYVKNVESRPFALMVNSQIPALVQHPLVRLGENLHGFYASNEDKLDLGEQQYRFHALREYASYLLIIPSKSGAYGDKSHLDDVLRMIKENAIESTQKLLGLINRTSSDGLEYLKVVEARAPDEPQKNVLSLLRIALAGFVRAKAEGADFSDWEKSAKGPSERALTYSNQHFVTDEQQIDGIIDFIAGLEPEQRAPIIPIVDIILRDQRSLEGMPALSEDNFSTEAKEVLKTLKPNDIRGEPSSVSGWFYDTLSLFVPEDSPLHGYPLKKTFAELDFSLTQLAGFRTLKPQLDAIMVPGTEKVDMVEFDALVAELVALAEPFKAEFKEQHPDY